MRRLRVAVAHRRGVAAVARRPALYALASVFFFSVFGGFLTYPLLALVGDVHMLRSSVAAQVSARHAVRARRRAARLSRGAGRDPAPIRPADRRPVVAARVRRVALLLVWVDRRTAVVRAASGRPGAIGRSRPTRNGCSCRRGGRRRPATARSAWPESFTTDDLADFEPVRRALRDRRRAPRAAVAARRPPNVILIVLESVAARWAGAESRPLRFDAAPARPKSARGLVFDNFYAHIGRSSNSLGAILLSTFPKLDFSDLTEEYPRLPGTSLASVFHDRGYRTAFVTPSDLDWADWRTFLDAAASTRWSIITSCRARRCCRRGAWRIAAPSTA